MNEVWEYKVMPLPKIALGIKGIKEALDVEGKYSWELVNILTYPNFKDLHSESESPFFAVFKRTKS